jgi:hypothetical protein
VLLINELEIVQALEQHQFDAIALIYNRIVLLSEIQFRSSHVCSSVIVLLSEIQFMVSSCAQPELFEQVTLRVLTNPVVHISGILEIKF